LNIKRESSAGFQLVILQIDSPHLISEIVNVVYCIGQDFFGWTGWARFWKSLILLRLCKW